jgi:large subunit ribosomal protein L19
MCGKTLPVSGLLLPLQRFSAISGGTSSPLYCVISTLLIHYELKMDLIKVAEEAFATGKQHPEFGPGDTITVAYRIKEGNKERIQQYRGVVIRISGEGNKKRFTVRKMSDNIGVERIFPIESPFIDSIVVNKYGKVRRAKLYYLRGLTGKKARIKERRVVK